MIKLWLKAALYGTILFWWFSQILNNYPIDELECNKEFNDGSVSWIGAEDVGAVVFE